MPSYDPAGVAERHGVSLATVLSWVRSGELRAICVSRSPNSRRPRVRISEQALADFEAARAVTPPAPAPVRRKRRTTGEMVRFYPEK